MTELKHTPTPWEEVHNLTGLMIRSKSGTDVLYNDSQCGDVEITKEDLTFIILACNNYEAMQKREEVLVKMVKDKIAKCLINIPRFDEEGDREAAVYNETRLELLEEILKSIKE